MVLRLLRTNATKLAFPCSATCHKSSTHSSNTSGKKRRISPPANSTCSATPPPRSRSSRVRVSKFAARLGGRLLRATGKADQASEAIPPARAANSAVKSKALSLTAGSGNLSKPAITLGTATRNSALCLAERREISVAMSKIANSFCSLWRAFTRIGSLRKVSRPTVGDSVI